MKLEDGCITARALLFSVFCFMQGTMLRAGFIISMTRNDSWIMAFSGLLLTLPLVSIYAALLRRFPGKSLIEIDNIIFGPVLGKAVSALYLFFFLLLAALNTRDLGNFAVDYMMRRRWSRRYPFSSCLGAFTRSAKGSGTSCAYQPSCVSPLRER